MTEKITPIYNFREITLEDRELAMELVVENINDTLGTSLTVRDLNAVNYSYLAAVRVKMVLGKPHIYILQITGTYLTERKNFGPRPYATLTLGVPRNSGIMLDEFCPPHPYLNRLPNETDQEWSKRMVGIMDSETYRWFLNMRKEMKNL